MTKQRIFLAHWTYSPEEWKTFLRWRKLQQGVFHYVFSRLFPSHIATVPEIVITYQKVWIGDKVESFSNQERQLKKVDIRDVGNMNIIEIIYETIRGGLPSHTCIHIPIPRGKLREAISVHENLSTFA